MKFFDAIQSVTTKLVNDLSHINYHNRSNQIMAASLAIISVCELYSINPYIFSEGLCRKGESFSLGFLAEQENSDFPGVTFLNPVGEPMEMQNIVCVTYKAYLCAAINGVLKGVGAGVIMEKLVSYFDEETPDNDESLNPTHPHSN